jgi:hypothetical protein
MATFPTITLTASGISTLRIPLSQLAQYYIGQYDTKSTVKLTDGSTWMVSESPSDIDTLIAAA